MLEQQTQAELELAAIQERIGEDRREFLAKSSRLRSYLRKFRKDRQGNPVPEERVVATALIETTLNGETVWTTIHRNGSSWNEADMAHYRLWLAESAAKAKVRAEKRARKASNAKRR